MQNTKCKIQNAKCKMQNPFLSAHCKTAFILAPIINIVLALQTIIIIIRAFILLPKPKHTYLDSQKDHKIACCDILVSKYPFNFYTKIYIELQDNACKQYKISQNAKNVSNIYVCIT